MSVWLTRRCTVDDVERASTETCFQTPTRFITALPAGFSQISSIAAWHGGQWAKNLGLPERVVLRRKKHNEPIAGVVVPALARLHVDTRPVVSAVRAACSLGSKP